MLRNVALFIFILAASIAWAEEPADLPVKEREPLPLWELGFGTAGAMTPDYPGSSQSHIKILPFPYAVYRGEILRSDRSGGTRARVVKTEVYELNLSGSGGLPTNSGDNQARLGMPDLDWTFELGPRVLIRLNKFKNGGVLKMGMALRAAYVTDGRSTRDQGFIFEPQMQLSYPSFPFKKSYSFVSLNAQFTERRYQQYYYEVEPQFATASRAQYHARGGFFGADSTVGTAFPVVDKTVNMAVFVNYASYAGAANTSSPLLRQQFGWSYGLAFIWTLKKSQRPAQGDF